jgi:hypothetical protein
MADWLKWKKGGRWQENDEGYHMMDCYRCRRRTEHDLGQCLECPPRPRRRADSKNSK